MQELSLNILDIAQNSISAGASLIEISVAASTPDDTLTIAVKDNGKGMSEKTLAEVTNPFYTTRTTRRVGLGIPLFKMAAEQTGGTLVIKSEVGKGTRIEAVFSLSSIDRMPLGAMDETFSQLVMLNESLDFRYSFSFDQSSFELDTRDIREIMGDIPLSSFEIVSYIKEFIRENTNECKGMYSL